MKNQPKFEIKIIDGIKMKVPLRDQDYHFLTSTYVERHYPKFYEYVNNLLPHITKWMEKLWLYFEGRSGPNICENPTCNNYVSFHTIVDGYRDRYCCSKCVSLDPNTIVKVRQTNLKHLGVPFPMMSESVRNKSKNTSLKKYGVSSPMKDKELCKKCIDSKKSKFIEKTENLLGYTENGDYIMDCPHKNEYPIDEKCLDCPGRYIIGTQTYNKRLKNGDELCSILSPINMCPISNLERRLWKMLEDLNIEFEHNKTGIIKGKIRTKELDIFISSLNLAIEANGSFYHSISNPNCNEQQHIEKFIQCIEKRIELITIWEDWDLEIVKNFLKDKLEGNDLSKYKEIWFPDLKENEWPNDLGWYKGVSPSPNKILSHTCKHNDFDCFDSGVVIIS